MLKRFLRQWNKNLALPVAIKDEDRYLYPSLDLVYQLAWERIGLQREYLNALDTKASFSLNTSTTLISAGLALQSLLLPQSHTFCSSYVPQFVHVLPFLLKRILPVLPLVVSYVVSIFLAYRAYTIRSFESPPHPRGLTHYLEKPEDVTKATLLSNLINAYEANEKMLFQKASLVRLSFMSLVGESLMLVLFLLFQVVC